MVTSGGWLFPILDGRHRLVSVYMFMRQMIEEHKEAEILRCLQRRFDVTWTSETHATLHDLLKMSLIDKGGVKSSLGFADLRQYNGMSEPVRQDFSDLRTTLLNDMKSVAQTTATVEIFERKMMACFPSFRRLY